MDNRGLSPIIHLLFMTYVMQDAEVKIAVTERVEQIA